MQKKKIQSFSFSRKMLMWWTKIMKRKGYTYIFSSLLKKVISSFLWCLGGCQQLQDEAEHLFPSHWLPKTH